jgi:hypothetical protein
MITGFALSKVVNAKLEDVGFEPIPSQLVYNYMRSGRIPFVLTVVNGKEVKRVTIEDARAFVSEFVGSKRNGSNGLAELLREFEDV